MHVVLVYLEWFPRNSVLKCVLQPNIAQNSLKTPILVGQGRSRSSVLVPLESSLAVLVMICSKSVSICSLFHARWANSGKITISKGGTPLWCPHSRGISSRSSTKITSLEARDSRLSYGEDPGLYLTRLFLHRVVTDGQTDRQTDRIAIANTRLSSTCWYSCGT